MPQGAPATEPSPRLKARIAGVLWLLVIIAGVFAEFFVRARLIVSGDAAATASRILASQELYRLGFVADLLATVCYLGVVLILDDLLRPVSRSLSSLAAGFGVVGSAVAAANLLNGYAPLIILGSSLPLPGFSPEQLQGLLRLFLRLRGAGSNLSLVFFSGFYLLLVGYLVVRSSYFPRVLGALLAIAGGCYLLNSFCVFLAPAVANLLFPAIMAPGFVAETSMTVWLIAVGLDPPKWKAAVGRDGSMTGPAQT